VSSLYTTLNRIIQRNYLAKWATIGLFIGIVAGVGATAFYFLIQFETNSMLGGITGFFPPTPRERQQHF
jgi:CIC family chloride channel protein